MSHWLIFYEDADVPVEVFTDEAAARKRLLEATLNWNCHLFAEDSVVERLKYDIELKDIRISTIDEWRIQNLVRKDEAELKAHDAEQRAAVAENRVKDLESALRNFMRASNIAKDITFAPAYKRAEALLG